VPDFQRGGAWGIFHLTSITITSQNVHVEVVSIKLLMRLELSCD
jgi:hypothetical protein